MWARHEDVRSWYMQHLKQAMSYQREEGRWGEVKASFFFFFFFEDILRLELLVVRCNNTGDTTV